MNSSLHLQRIGVTAWRWRGRAPTPAPLCCTDVHVYTLSTAAGPVGLLLADAGAALANETVLVEAIATATQRQVAGGHQAMWTCAWTALPPVVIALGERVGSALQAASTAEDAWRGHVVISHAPAALLNDRSLKAQTWQVLQSAMRVMA